MKVDKQGIDHISQTFHIDHLTEEEKKSDNYKGSDSNKNESFCFEYGMVRGCSEDEIDENNENKNQKEISPRLKKKEIREKLISYYNVTISAAEFRRKDIPGLIPSIIYNYYKLFNEKRPIQKSRRKFIIKKDISLKVEN